jgi:hypothetical protein
MARIVLFLLKNVLTNPYEKFVTMHFESMNEALIACVKASGGSKSVGAAMWPDMAPDHAQRKLLNALDESRPEKLSPTQVLLILRMAKQRGFHEGIAHILESLSYAPTTPIEPRDEAADLMRQVIESQRQLAVQMERLASLQPQLRAVA